MSVKIVSSRPDGSRLLTIGLAQGNIDHLRQGHPYLAKAEETGIGVDVVIVFKPKIEDVVAYLRECGMALPEGAEEFAKAVHNTKGGRA